MIRRIFLQDFKAFHHLSLEIRPLTILVGENNSGKSSVFASLRLLAQTIQSDDSSIPLLLSGPMGDFGAFRDVVHGNHRGRPLVLGMTVDELPLAATQPSVPNSPRQVSFRSEFKYRTQRRETILRSTEIDIDSRPVIRIATTNERDSVVLSKIGSWTVPDAARSTVRSTNLRIVNFLPRVFGDARRQETRSPDVAEAQRRLSEIERSSSRAHNSIMRALLSLEHIGPMRQPPERTYVNTGVSGQRIGTDGANWPAMFALDSARRNPQLGLVQSWMKDAGIAEQISVSWLTDRHYEITVTNPASGETANIADVGQGTSQVLPVVIAGARLRPGETFIAEEPEIHLHPRAQAALGDYFAGLVNGGVQCLVETHSEYLILRVQQWVALGALSPRDVIFYYVHADKHGKHITEITLDSTGTFTSGLPGGFFPQRLEEATKLAQARHGVRP